MAKALGRSENFIWSYNLSAHLPEEVEYGTTFPLHYLDTKLVRQHPGPLDAQVCGLQESDGDPTHDVSVCPIVGLLPHCGESTGYPFHGSLHLHTKQTFFGGNKGREMSTLLEACLQVHLPLHPLRLL